MIISPCGWFALEEPEGWLVEETPNSIILTKDEMDSKLEITSARKEQVIQDEDIFDLIEEFGKGVDVPKQNTTLQTIPENRINCIHAIFLNADEIVCPLYAYWSHYCVQILITCPYDGRTEEIFMDVRMILATLQPMIEE